MVWHLILQPAFDTSQLMWLCWSFWHELKQEPAVTAEWAVWLWQRRFGKFIISRPQLCFSSHQDMLLKKKKTKKEALQQDTIHHQEERIHPHTFLSILCLVYSGFCETTFCQCYPNWVTKDDRQNDCNLLKRSLWLLHFLFHVPWW